MAAKVETFEPGGFRGSDDADRGGGYVAPVLQYARREPSAILLAAQLAGVLLYLSLIHI